MATIKGILSFPAIFTPKIPKGSTEAKYGCTLLLPPTDPQVAALLAEVEIAKANGFPSGYTGTNECVELYDKKYAGKDYYDARFSGWYIFSCTGKLEDGIPPVVNMDRTPLIDRAKIYSGAMVWVSAGISAYEKGTGGIGGWLNGVMVTDEEPPMGRLDGAQTVDQMFNGVGGAPTAPASPGKPAAPSAPAALVMTAAAEGVTYETYMSTEGWTDALLISNGLATRPAAPAKPAPPAAPAKPLAPPAPAALIMTAAAEGVTYETYMSTEGWTEELLISQGLAIRPSFS
jgi:hypothetical protein